MKYKTMIIFIIMIGLLSLLLCFYNSHKILFNGNKTQKSSEYYSLDKSTYQQVGQFFKDKNRVLVGLDNPYLPSSGDESGKNIIDVDAVSFKQVLCQNGLTDQYGNMVEIYVDKNRLFFDGKGSGASILFGVGTGFDYDSIQCNESEIIDKNGTYAIIHGKNFWNITVLSRLHKL